MELRSIPFVDEILPSIALRCCRLEISSRAYSSKESGLDGPTAGVEVAVSEIQTHLPRVWVKKKKKRGK